MKSEIEIFDFSNWDMRKMCVKSMVKIQTLCTIFGV